jgi:hypothetical protein
LTGLKVNPGVLMRGNYNARLPAFV